MSGWIWLNRAVVIAVHDIQLAEHGGGAGVRDAGLLDSALARPLNLVADGEPDAPALAAAYGYGISRNHPFIDGNKRTAFAAAGIFLELNGQRLAAPEPEAVQAVLALTNSEMKVAEFAAWLRSSSVPSER
jgi:death-on-curing protein